MEVLGAGLPQAAKGHSVGCFLGMKSTIKRADVEKTSLKS